MAHNPGKPVVETGNYKGTPMFTVRPENCEPYKYPNFGVNKWALVLSTDKNGRSVLMQLVEHQEKNNADFRQVEASLDQFVNEYLAWKQRRDAVGYQAIMDKAA